MYKTEFTGKSQPEICLIPEISLINKDTKGCF